MVSLGSYIYMRCDCLLNISHSIIIDLFSQTRNFFCQVLPEIYPHRSQSEQSSGWEMKSWFVQARGTLGAGRRLNRLEYLESAPQLDLEYRRSAYQGDTESYYIHESTLTDIRFLQPQFYQPDRSGSVFLRLAFSNRVWIVCTRASKPLVSRLDRRHRYASIECDWWSRRQESATNAAQVPTLQNAKHLIRSCDVIKQVLFVCPCVPRRKRNETLNSR